MEGPPIRSLFPPWRPAPPQQQEYPESPISENFWHALREFITFILLMTNNLCLANYGQKNDKLTNNWLNIGQNSHFISYTHIACLRHLEILLRIPRQYPPS